MFKSLKTEEFSKSTPLDELVHATQMNLRASGHRTASKLVENIVTPKNAFKYNEEIRQWNSCK